MQIFAAIASAQRAIGPRAFRAVLTAAGLLCGVSAESATFTVNNTGDGGDANLGDNLCQTASAVCTLRAAIQQANATAGTDVIAFSVSGTFVISPASSLPDITQAVIVDGTTAPSYGGTPVVVLNGASAGGGVNGLTLAGGSGGSTVRALVVQSFSGHGIVVSSDGNSLTRNRLGTNAGGTAAAGNGGYGMVVLGHNNILGGADYNERNLLSANGTGGIYVGGGTGNQVPFAFIGTNFAGTAALANGGSGLTLQSASASMVRQGVISGNAVDGVRIVGGGSNVVTSNNLIGLNVDGTSAIANGNHGVYIESSSSNTVGAANIISGNAFAGVYITGPASTGNLVISNFIGTRLSGTTALGNTGPGVAIVSAGGGNQVGNAGAGLGNVISGNGGPGVFVSGADGTSVLSNTIGSDPTGSFAIPNGGNGVEVQESANAVIGISAEGGSGNLVSGNGGSGIVITGAGSTGPLVAGNTVGARQDGMVAIPNGGHGIVLVGISGAVVGGDVTGEDNVVVGNALNGIYISGGANNQVLLNEVGIDGTGIVAVPNGLAGVLVENSTGTKIQSALVSGNTGDGIRLVGGSGALLISNIVGTDVFGTAAVGNGGNGISLENSASHTVGRPVSGEGNVVSGNLGSGVRIAGALSTGNVVRNTVIGLDLSATALLPNGGHGVLIEAASGNTVGGTAATDANRIAGNGGSGVAVLSGVSNRIRLNLVHSNGRLAIDLDRDGVLPLDGVTFNDPGDGDGGANALQNHPVLTQATDDTVDGVLRGSPNTAYAIDLFSSSACDAAGFGEGAALRNTTTVTTDGNGTAAFLIGFAAVGPGTVLAATATDPSGNTSELSQCVEVWRVPVDTLTLFNPTQSFVSLIASPRDLPPLDAYTRFVAVAPVQGRWVVGDWNGDGIETPAVYGDNGAFYYTNDVGQTANWTGIWFGFLGRPPVAGRFDVGVSHDCLGVVDGAAWPPYGTAYALYFTCELTSGEDPPKDFQWIGPVLPDSDGFNGQHQFAAGDFDGDGVDSMAVRRGPYIAWTNVAPTTLVGEFGLAQYIGAPGVGYGQVVAGDWDGNALDSFALFYPDGSLYRRYDLDWNSGAYALQHVGQPIGTPVTASSWRPGGSAGNLP